MNAHTRSISARFLACIALGFWTVVASAPALAADASPNAPEANLHGSPEILSKLLPDGTRLLIKVSPHRMRAATARLSRWLPAELSMYHRNRHPEARLAAAALTGAPLSQFMDDYADERLPDFSAHASNSPAFLAVTVPRSEQFLEMARRGLPLFEPAALPKYIHYRVLIPSDSPGELVDAVGTYCKPNPKIRRMGSCKGKLGARSQSGYLVLDAATPLLTDEIEHRSSLRRRLGYETDSTPSSPRTLGMHVAPSMPDVSASERDRPLFDRQTPAARRFLSSHHAFELYARIGDLWELFATLQGATNRNNSSVANLSGFPRAPLRAASMLTGFDPATQEIEDLHLRAMLGPKQSLSVTLTGTLTEVGLDYAPAEDSTPTFSPPAIQSPNFRLSWDTGAFQSLQDVALPSWVTERLAAKELFRSHGDDVVTNRDIVRSRLRGMSGQLLSLSHPMALSAMSRRQEIDAFTIFEFTRDTSVWPVAGDITAHFRQELDSRKLPLRRFGASFLTPNLSPSLPDKKRLRRALNLYELTEFHVRTDDVEAFGRVDAVGGTTFDGNNVERAQSSGAKVSPDTLDDVILRADFASMFGSFLNLDEEPYGSEMYIRLARMGRLHARAGRRGNEYGAVATFGNLSSESVPALEPAPDKGTFAPLAPEAPTDERHCRSRWLRNLTYAADRNWLIRPEGIDRLQQIGTTCDSSSDASSDWLATATRQWARLLSHELLATAQFQTAAAYARLGCRAVNQNWCPNLNSLTQLASSMQLPGPSAAHRSASPLGTNRLDLMSPQPTIVSVTGRGVFFDDERVMSLDAFERSHLESGARETFRDALRVHLRQRVDRYLWLKSRLDPAVTETEPTTTALLALDRRAPSSAAIKLLEMMPEAFELQLLDDDPGTFLLRGAEPGNTSAFSVEPKPRTTSMHGETLFVRLTTDGIRVELPDGPMSPIGDCDRLGLTYCNERPNATRTHLLRASLPTFSRHREALRPKTDYVYRFHGHTRNPIISRAGATVLFERASANVGIRQTTDRIAEWSEDKLETLRKHHDGYGRPPPSIEQFVVMPDAEVPWALTVELLTELTTISTGEHYGPEGAAIHLARPSLTWNSKDEQQKGNQQSGGTQ